MTTATEGTPNDSLPPPVETPSTALYSIDENHVLGTPFNGCLLTPVQMEFYERSRQRQHETCNNAFILAHKDFAAEEKFQNQVLGGGFVGNNAA
jgi:hypothetical protein